MYGNEGEEGYSDDDLDALPIHDFQELQQDAIRSTQQQHRPGQHNSPDHDGGSIAHKHLGIHGKSVPNSNGFTHQPSSDYGDFDDEMLDGEIFEAAEEPGILQEQRTAVRVPFQSNQREQRQLQGQSRSPVNARLQGRYTGHPEQPVTNGNAAAANSLLKQGRSSQAKSAEVHTDPDRQQSRIDELLRENERLRFEFDAAKTEALSKSGEIAIVRANRAKEKQEEERRLAAERILRAEEQANYKTEIVKYQTELQKLNTDKAFAENDLAREAEQRRGALKPKETRKSKASNREDTVTTPKKKKDIAYGDGFNKDEIQGPSPPKLALRSKPVTPKAGAKRKRKPTENSPMKPLQLSQINKLHDRVQPEEQPNDQSFGETIQVQEDKAPTSYLRHQNLQDERLEITQKILDHRVFPDDKRTVEVLMEFSLPSQPDRTISSIFLDGLSALRRTTGADNFVSSIGLNVMSLWSQCLDASMYRPVVLLMDLIRFMLIISPSGTAHLMTDELAPLAQRTADVNLIPRIRRKPPSRLTAEVTTKRCLEILHLMAYDCLWQKEDLERFWRCIRVDFIAMALKIDQPIDEISIALDLLRASVFENTFAMIRSAADGDQESSEQGLLQILSSLLTETPRVVEGQEPYDVTDIAQLRLEVLSLMEKMCETEHGGEAQAKCVNVFVRLIRFMNDEIAALYDYRHGHEYRIELINQSMRLLYHITTSYSHLINIQERLATTPGGAHKYLIILTRLNFSDGIFYEEGIEDDVVECAQHLLENWVTPEEGEALVESFSSARR